MIDMHSHILPQIDDGPVNIDESIKMLKEAYKAGFTDIVSTSHYIVNEYCTTKEERKKLIQILEERLKLENIKINIYNGAVTSIHGVESNKIISNCFFNSSNPSSILSLDNNSEGFGGTFPAGIILKFSMSVSII